MRNTELGPNQPMTPKGWLNFCHKACGDNRFRLGIHPYKKRYRCFNCGASGPLERLLPDGLPQVRTIPQPRSTPQEPASEHFREVTGSGPTHPFEAPVVAYLASRSISRLRAKTMGLGYGVKPPFLGCVIHPWFDDYGNLAGFQGRKSYPVEQGAKVLTYSHGSLTAGKGGVYLLERVKVGDPIVLTEGPYDALSAARVLPSVALLGSVLHGAQVSRLLARQPSYVVLALDPDTYTPKPGQPTPATVKAARALLKARPGLDVRVVQYPDTFVGDLGTPPPRSVVERLIVTAERFPLGA